MKTLTYEKLFLFWFLVALAACTSDPINTDTLPAPSEPRQGIIVPVEEALQELDGLMQALAQHTRAGETSDHRKAGYP